MSNCQNGTHRLYITVHGCWIWYVWLFLGKWLRLDRERNKKKEEFKKVQESYRPQHPHPITLKQLPLGATDLILQKLFKIGKLFKVFRKLDLLTIRIGKLWTHPNFPKSRICALQNWPKKNKKTHYMWSCVNIIHHTWWLFMHRPASEQAAHGGWWCI